MSADVWQPGDVAWLTVHGRSSYLGMRSVEMGGSWVTAAAVAGVHLHGSHDVTEARRLVVIDPEDRDQVERLARAITKDAGLMAGWTSELDIASSTQRALLGLIEPPLEEPTGRYAVVIADEVAWCRAAWASAKPWSRIGTEHFAAWEDMRVTSIESEGVTP